MAAGLVTVARFAELTDAHRARQRLERAGILAEVSPSNSFGILSNGGAAGACIFLQVNEFERQRAGDVLLGVADCEVPVELQDFWYCRDCREVVDPGFDVCWSCLQPREDVADPSFRPTLAVLAEEPEEDGSAQHPVFELLRAGSRIPGEDLSEFQRFGRAADGASEWSILPVTQLDDLVTRAWRASVLGLFLFPPVLHVYSMCLLLRVSLSRGGLHPRSNRRFYLAIAVNLLVGLASGVVSSIRWAGGPW